MTTTPHEWDVGRWSRPDALPLAREVMGRVAVCSPVYDHATHQTAIQIAALQAVGARVIQPVGGSNVAHIRNVTTAAFLASDREWSLWIDGDVSAPEGPAAWLEFVMHGQQKGPFVGGLYAVKVPGKRSFACGFSEPSVRIGEGGDYYTARWCGGGALLVHRSVFERISQCLGDEGSLYYPWPGSADIVGPRAWRNGVIKKNGHMVEHGEDMGLCLLARECRFQLLVDTRLRLDHEGTHRFTWEDALAPPPPREVSHVLQTEET
jgi:hypothetical protein